MTQPKMPMPHDAWNRKALGKSGEEVWLTLLIKGETTAVSIAQLTGRNIRTVQRALKRLTANGLAMPAGNGYWQGEPADDDYLDQIAEEYGTLGETDRKRKQHQRERAIRAADLIYRTKRAWGRAHNYRAALISSNC